MGRNTSEEVVTVDMGCNTSDNVRLCDNITTLALHGLAIYNMCMCNSIFRIVLFAWIAAALMLLLQLFCFFFFRQRAAALIQQQQQQQQTEAAAARDADSTNTPRLELQISVY